MKRVLVATGIGLCAWLGFAPAAVADPPEMVTICHAAGLAEDPANWITLTLPWQAVYGQAGHFNENGTPQAGHEQDYLGACEVEPSPTTPPPTTPPPTTPPPTTPPPTSPPPPPPPPPPTTPPPTTTPPPLDLCPNLDGIQTEVPKGYVRLRMGNRVVCIEAPTPGPTRPTEAPPSDPDRPVRETEPPELAFTGLGDVSLWAVLTMLWLAGLGGAMLIVGRRADRAFGGGKRKKF